MMIVIVCALLSAAFFYLSTGLGNLWPLAWIAPAPLLWLAYGETRPWRLALAAFGTVAVEALLALLQPGIRLLPLPVIGLLLGEQIIGLTAILIASLFFARYAKRRLTPLSALLAFPAFWTSYEYVFSLVSPDGTAPLSLAYSQVDAPILAQSASLFGMSGVTFLVCFLANAAALGLREKAHAFAIGTIAVAVFAANLAFGGYRLHEMQTDVVRVGVAAKDVGGISIPNKRETVVAAADAYADAARKLVAQRATIVVLPELIGLLPPQWRDETLAPFANAARETGTQVVAGFAAVREGVFSNDALIFAQDGTLATYIKRHPLTGLDPSIPGSKPGLLGNGRAVAICKDMDFPRMIRSDAKNGVRLMLVPAADFDDDGWEHARMAIMRSIEDGFAMARAARNGLLTVNDSHGRIVAVARSGKDDIASLVADVPLGPGNTLYLRIGDAFAWFCLALTGALAILALIRFGRTTRKESSTKQP